MSGQTRLAQALKEATDEQILQELLCAAFPKLKDARDEYRQQAQAAWVLNDFFQFVRESVEPPIARRLNWKSLRVGDTMLPEKINDTQYTVSQNMLYVLEQMGFEFNHSRYFHPIYDFAVCFERPESERCVDATKTSLRHFFRRFYAHVEQRGYEQAEINYIGER